MGEGMTEFCFQNSPKIRPLLPPQLLSLSNHALACEASGTNCAPDRRTSKVEADSKTPVNLIIENGRC